MRVKFGVRVSVSFRRRLRASVGVIVTFRVGFRLRVRRGLWFGFG